MVGWITHWIVWNGIVRNRNMRPWLDEPTMRNAWARFMDDAEWKEIKRVTGAQHGDLVGEIEDRMLRLTSYSPSVLPSKQT